MLQLVLAWGLVGIPLALGVLQTLINSMKLFQWPHYQSRRRFLRNKEGSGARFL
jgi:hypothetical protein